MLSGPYSLTLMVRVIYLSPIIACMGGVAIIGNSIGVTGWDPAEIGSYWTKIGGIALLGLILTYFVETQPIILEAMFLSNDGRVEIFTGLCWDGYGA